ncbi:hypothetical protein J4467_03535 [Candidatus Woesearchaeota archaeon]|nr:hypothetical protein [Candidatus Woesearchaeota archaeon]
MISFIFNDLEAYKNFINLISNRKLTPEQINSILCRNRGIPEIDLNPPREGDYEALVQKVRGIMDGVYNGLRGRPDKSNLPSDGRISQIAADYFLELLNRASYKLEENTERALISFLDFSEDGHNFLYTSQNISNTVLKQIAEKLFICCQNTVYTNTVTASRLFVILTSGNICRFKLCNGTDYQINSRRPFNSNFTNFILKPLVLKYAREGCSHLDGKGILNKKAYF